MVARDLGEGDGAIEDLRGERVDRPARATRRGADLLQVEATAAPLAATA